MVKNEAYGPHIVASRSEIVGWALSDQISKAQKQINALAPYRDYEAVQEEIRRLQAVLYKSVADLNELNESLGNHEGVRFAYRSLDG